MTDSTQIIITGISSDLGGILGRELASSPDSTIIGAMRRRTTNEDKFPENVHVLDDCDFTDSHCCSRIAATARRLFKGQFGVVHCAGDFWNHVPFTECSPDDARSVFESHVTTFYNVMQSLIPIMKASGGGSVVAFSCNSTLYHYPWMTAFTASKTAIDSMVNSLANEYSGDNIRFNSLRLSSLKTDRVRQSKPRGDFDHFTPPDHIAPIVRFLLSEDAYLVNGNAISIFRHSDKFYTQGYFPRVTK